MYGVYKAKYSISCVYKLHKKTLKKIFCLCKKPIYKFKKVCYNISTVRETKQTVPTEKILEKNFKKPLTNFKKCAII